MSMQLTQMQQYELGVMLRRHSLYMEFPAHVHMETLSQCNAACNFCPYPVLERQGTKMDDTLVTKILHDLQGIPTSLPFQLSPFKVNEPFLDVRLFDILEQINQQLPSASITLTSNATPITEKALLQLRKVRNIQYLWISFNDHREKDYEETMQLPYKRTIERLNLIHQHKLSGTIPFMVVLSRVGDRTQVDQEFCQWVQQHYPAFQSSVFPRMGWLGQIDIETGPVPDLPCQRWFELSITSTGVVAHCCTDGQAKWPIGNVLEQSALEIYNAPHYRKLRERTVSRLHVEPCNTCNFL